MNRITASVLLLFSATAAHTAFATTIQVTSAGNVPDTSGQPAGPYPGILNGTTAVTLFCDDFLHNITIGQTVTVNVSTINDLSLTRFGGPGASPNLGAAATSIYEQIFYLSSFLTGANSMASPYAPGTVSDKQSVQADIQDAMWSYFDPSVENASTAQAKYWLNKAAANYSGYNYSSFRVLTDANNQYSGKQELFYGSMTNNGSSVASAPEPGTVAMMLSGIAAVAFAGLRRRFTRAGVQA